MNEYDYLAKILILGEPNTGKTTLWGRYCEGVFISHKIAMPGVDFRLKKIEVDEKKVKMQIWDTSNQERYGEYMPHFLYKNVHGVILCYGVNNRNSFERVEHWIGEMRQYASHDICIVLVGTKSDLSDERVVSIEEGRKLAESNGIKFFETSAKENLNIDEAFLALTRDISQVLSKKNNENGKVGIRLHSREDNQKVEKNCFNCS